MRYHGKIGYFETVETKPGLMEKKIIFKEAYGDVVRNTKRDQSNTWVNDTIVVSNQISIVADPYAREHFFYIKCIEWQGALWKVNSVDVQYPRLVLELGGLYDEDLE
jgi:hypothetical protein